MTGPDPALEKVRMHAAQGVTRAVDSTARAHFRAILDLVDRELSSAGASDRAARAGSERIECECDRGRE